MSGESCGNQELAEVSIESLDGCCKIELKGAMVSGVLRYISDSQPTNKDVSVFPYLRDVTIDELPNARVDILLSMHHAWAWETGVVIRGPKHLPFAKKTAFGYCLMGPKRKGEIMDITSSFCLSADDESLRHVIEKYFGR